MTSNIINKGALLREQRLFPQDPASLVVEIDRSYVDIASKANDKTIGFFPTNGAALTGEKWSIDGVTYLGFRQAYPFVAADLPNIPHKLELTNIYSFTRMYGMFTDNTNWYPLAYVDSTSALNQVAISITPTNISIVGGGGGGQPTIVKGIVVLEWIGSS